MAKPLSHQQVHGLLTSLASAEILNIDAPIRALVEPVAEGLKAGGMGDEVALHILCCNEYALVTGLTADMAGDLGEIRSVAEAIRASLNR